MIQLQLVIVHISRLYLSLLLRLHGALCPGKAPIRSDKPFNHRRDQPLGWRRALRFTIVQRGVIVDEITVQPRRYFDSQLYGLLVGEVCQLQSRH